MKIRIRRTKEKRKMNIRHCNKKKCLTLPIKEIWTKYLILMYFKCNFSSAYVFIIFYWSSDNASVDIFCGILGSSEILHVMFSLRHRFLSIFIVLYTTLRRYILRTSWIFWHKAFSLRHRFLSYFFSLYSVSEDKFYELLWYTEILIWSLFVTLQIVLVFYSSLHNASADIFYGLLGFSELLTNNFPSSIDFSGFSLHEDQLRFSFILSCIFYFCFFIPDKILNLLISKARRQIRQIFDWTD